MKCYNSHEQEAVGICKNCNKGLCMDCLTEINGQIACTNTCIEEVEELQKLLKREKKTYRTASGSYKQSTFIYGSIGMSFLFFGIKYERTIGFLTIGGIIFIIGGILSFITAKRINKQ